MKASYEKETTYAENKALQAIKKKPKFFYAYAQQKSKIKRLIGPLEDQDGKLTGDPESVANLLEDQYKKVFAVPVPHKAKKKSKVFSSDEDQAPTIKDINFGKEEVIKAINEIRENSTAGPDQLPATLLKRCRHSLAAPITTIWKKIT